MKRLTTTLAAAFIGVLLASCTGATDRAALPPTGGHLADGKSRRQGGLLLRVRIPHGRNHDRSRYISAATVSIAITITARSTGKAHAYNYNLSPSSNPSCSGTPTTCNLIIPLAPGRYDASLATFDGALDRAGYPTGNELSANQSVAFAVLAGMPNTISVVLGGIPASVVLVPSASSQLSGNTASGFSLSRCGVGGQKVSALTADADGDLILGPGAPDVTLSSDSTSLVVSEPPTLRPHGFLLTPPTPPSYPYPGRTVHLTATVQPAASAGAPDLRQLLDVTFSSSLCGVFTEFKVPTPMSSPQAITVGADGALWFTENAANKIGRIPTTATTSNPRISEYAIPSTNSHPFAITSGSDGALWFTECYPGNIARMPTSGSPVYEFPIPTVPSAPQGIVAGPDSNLWFTESKGNKIGKIPTVGTISIKEFPIPTPSSVPFTITAGPDGALWFVESLGNKVGRIPVTATTVSPQITEYPAPTPSSFPRAIAVGPDGALWFTETLANQIGRLLPGGSITEYSMPSPGQPKGIVAGPDGDLWAIENTGNNLLQIPVTGTAMIELPIPTAHAVSGDPSIVLGPDGSLWFTETSANRIGRLQ